MMLTIAFLLSLSLLNQSPSPSPMSSPFASPSPSSSGAPTPTPAARDEIYAYTWSASKNKASHLYPMIWSNSWTTAADDKRRADLNPVGRRGFFLSESGILGNAEDKCIDPKTYQKTANQCPFFSGGITALKNRYRKYWQDYKALGGSIDAMILDTEQGMSIWGALAYSDIQNDPRFQPLIVPILKSIAGPQNAALDFNHFMDLTQSYFKTGDPNAPYIWDAVSALLIEQALNEGMLNPLRESFPSADMSDYSSMWVDPRYDVFDLNKWQYNLYALPILEGSVQAPVEYGDIGWIKIYKLDGIHTYDPTPFNGMRLDLNTMRAAVLAGHLHGDLGITPWIPFWSYTGWGYGLVPYASTPYYAEMVLHTILSGSKYLLDWNPKDPNATVAMTTDADDVYLDAVLTEANSLVGYVDRKTTLTKQIGWGDSYVLTTMTANHQKVSRLTVDPQYGPIQCGQSSSVACRVSKTGEMINFPAGRIWKGNPQFSAGVWILQPL